MTGTGVVARDSTFHGRYTGHGPGQSTIGIGGNYQSLFDATSDVCKNPLTGGDWEFVVLSDLTETKNSVMGQRNTNGHMITFRPAAATSVTVTFSPTTLLDVSGRWTGHFLIGANASYSSSRPHLELNPMSNIIIDGSSSTGGIDRSLYFKNTSSLNITNLIQVIGDCDNVTIRNCSFFNAGHHQFNYFGEGDIGTVDFIPGHPYDLAMYQRATLSNPDNCSVTNCEITSLEPRCGGIGFDGRRPSTSLPAGIPGASGVRIQGNTIRTQNFGVVTQFCRDSLITSNTIVVGNLPAFYSGTRSGITCSGITNAETAYGENAVISGNRITFESDSPTSRSQYGITLNGKRTPSRFNVNNNFISGLTRPAVGYGSLQRYGIWNGTDPASTATIVHNSINFHHAANTAATTAALTAAIYVGDNNPYPVPFPETGNTVLANNIIRMPVPGGAAISGTRIQPHRWASNHNNLFTGNGAVTATNNGIVYTSLAQWQSATGQDADSMAVDPFVPQGPGLGTWIGPAGSSNPDMHFSSFPGEMYQAVGLHDALYDIDGEIRNPSAVVIGADEVAQPASGTDDWHLY